MYLDNTYVWQHHCTPSCYAYCEAIRGAQREHHAIVSILRNTLETRRKNEEVWREAIYPGSRYSIQPLAGQAMDDREESPSSGEGTSDSRGAAGGQSTGPVGRDSYICPVCGLLGWHDHSGNTASFLDETTGEPLANHWNRELLLKLLQGKMNDEDYIAASFNVDAFSLSTEK